MKAGTLHIDSIKISNDGGSISAQKNLHLYNRGHWDNGSSQLLAGGDMTLNDHRYLHISIVKKYLKKQREIPRLLAGEGEG